MPKGMDAPLATSTNNASFVWGHKDGIFVKYPAQVFEVPGPQGIAGANGLDGTTYALTDNTGASSDLLLNVGDTAYIDYSSATSVPLHIQTVEGIYELQIIGDATVAVGAAGYVSLKPNNDLITAVVNGSGAAGDIDHSAVYNSYGTTGVGSSSGGFYADGDSMTAFPLTYQLAVQIKATISTITKNKTMRAEVFGKRTSPLYSSEFYTNHWTNSTTAWTSLGTITFPFAQSGKIIIKRII